MSKWENGNYQEVEWMNQVNPKTSLFTCIYWYPGDIGLWPEIMARGTK